LEPQAWEKTFPNNGAVKYQVTGNYYLSSTENNVMNTPILIYSKGHTKGVQVPWEKNVIHISDNYLEGKLIQGWDGIVNLKGSQPLNPALKPADRFFELDHDGKNVFTYLTKTSRNVGAQPLDPVDIQLLQDIRGKKGTFLSLPPKTWQSAGWTNKPSTTAPREVNGLYLPDIIDCENATLATTEACDLSKIVYDGKPLNLEDATSDIEDRENAQVEAVDTDDNAKPFELTTVHYIVGGAAGLCLLVAAVVVGAIMYNKRRTGSKPNEGASRV
jgi:hypothetical protein